MSSKYADEGTIAHVLAAMCLTEGKDAAAYIGRILEAEDYPHSDLSPSGAYRWMTCPGSVALETRIKFVPRKHSREIDDDMAEGVQIYLDNLRQYAAGKELFIEQKLDISNVIGVPDHGGMGDAVILDYAAAEIQAHDLKFGKGVYVSADKNEQLQLYGLGALELFDAVAPEGGWKRFRAVIHQPRISNDPSEWTCSIDELRKFGERAKERAFHALQTRNEKPGALIHHLKPGEKQCKFCEAKASCPALARVVLHTVLDDFQDLTTEDINPMAVLEAEVAKVAVDDNALLAELYKKVALIEGWCSAVAAAAEAKILAGENVPGFKVVAGRKGNRAWSDETQATEALKSFRLKSDEMYSKKLISPAAAEKLVPDGEEKALGKQKRRWEKLAGLITQAGAKPTVAPENDPRPALEIKPASEDFQNLETNQEELV